jgi:transposase-like protein
MKETPVPTKKTRRKFDLNFKREAVALWQNSGKPAQEIAHQLGICEGQLYEWRRTLAPAGHGDLQAENTALRRENALLRQQRDILKKTLGIISEPLKNASNGSTR